LIRRSLGHGSAGIDDELYTGPRTALLFGDAEAVLGTLVAGLHVYVS
jgi:NAD(P) transhydrogenase subunit beta